VSKADRGEIESNCQSPKTGKREKNAGGSKKKTLRQKADMEVRKKKKGKTHREIRGKRLPVGGGEVT